MSDPFYRTDTWRRLREACLRRDPICVNPGCGRRATDADHIMPRAKGGPDTLANLRGLCSDCHKRRRAKGHGRLAPIGGCDADGRPLDPRHWWNRP